MSAERSESPKSPKFTTAWLGPQIQKVQRDASFVRKNVSDDQKYTQHKYWKDRNKNTLRAPYSPISEDFEAYGLINQIKLSEDVWSAALLGWIMVPWELRDTSWGWISFIVPPQLTLMVSVYFQVTITYWTKEALVDMRHNDENTCSGSDMSLRLVALCVFIAYGAGTEIMEALSANRWLSAFPKWDEKLHKNVIDQAKKRGTHDFTATLCFQDATNERGFSASVPAIGLSFKFKLFSRVFYILARIFITVIIIIEASGIILYSKSNMEVIAGTIMAKYILEIDDYIYKALITAMLKNDIKCIPPIGVAPSIGMNNADSWWNYCGTYFLMIALVLAVWSLHVAWCDGNTLNSCLIFWIPMAFGTLFLSWESKNMWHEEDPYAYRDWKEKNEDKKAIELVGGKEPDWVSNLAC